MPSSTDDIPTQDDTPDEAKTIKPIGAGRKKKQKKTAKSRAELVDECKDSSSEDPKPSPDLPPIVACPVSTCPPSTPLDAHEPPATIGHRSPVDIGDESPTPPTPPALPTSHPLSPHEQLPVLCLQPSPSPSPDQDEVIEPQGDGVRIGSRGLSAAGSLQHVSPPLSTSPQGGIRLPTTSPAPLRSHAASPTTTPTAPLPLRQRPTQSLHKPLRSSSSYEPPPPHLPQRHFSRVSNINFTMPVHSSASAITPGSRGFFAGLDSLSSSNSVVPAAAHNVVLIGWQGGLDIYTLHRQRADIIGRLEGLRGSVVYAKILPWVERTDPFATLRPLMTCVVHGPVLASIADRATQDHDLASTITQYQTTVEVYSLATSEHVATIFQAPPVNLNHPVTHHLFSAPPPSGDLQVAAEGRFITVSSGVSGEVYVFAIDVHDSTGGLLPDFLCIGKFWTSVQSKSSVLEGHEGQSADTVNGGDQEQKVAVTALSQRWLAVSPPLLSSSQVSLRGSAKLSSHNLDPPGVSTHVCPAAPPATCDIDAPAGSSLLNRVTKQATQEIRKGAQWVGEQGLQAWKSYWNRPQPLSAENASHPTQKASTAGPSMFPPTHAHHTEPLPSTIDPALVSVVDLDQLLNGQNARGKVAIQPLATFSLADGCSFLSFAPNGLSLLVANHNGDVTSIWDLMRMTDARLSSQRFPGSTNGTESSVGRIRMLARFARMSPSTITSVAWSPLGSKLAILTAKGTVHLHELPAQSESGSMSFPTSGSLPRAPPTQPSPSSSPQEDEISAGILGNMKAGWQSLHGLAARSRGSSSGVGLPTLSSLGQASATVRYVGGRAVRQGFSKGLGMAAEGAHQIRHGDDNKLRLRFQRQIAAAGCIRWLGGKDRDFIATFVDGKVSLQAVKCTFHMQGKRTVASLAVSKKPITELTLQPISGEFLPPVLAGILDPTGPHAMCSKEGMHRFWMHNRAMPVRRISSNTGKRFAAAVTQDKDTGPAYMPFHRHPQVGLFTYNEAEPARTSKKQIKRIHTGSAGGPAEAWVFGLPLQSVSRINYQQFVVDDDFTQGITDGDVDLLGNMDGTFGMKTRASSLGGRDPEEQEDDIML